jgi:hypothetical protein
MALLKQVIPGYVEAVWQLGSKRGLHEACEVFAENAHDVCRIRRDSTGGRIAERFFAYAARGVPEDGAVPQLGTGRQQRVETRLPGAFSRKEGFCCGAPPE